MIYSIHGTEYEIYQAASGDYCVTVTEPEGKSDSYNVGTREEALLFILSYYKTE